MSRLRQRLERVLHMLACLSLISVSSAELRGTPKAKDLPRLPNAALLIGNWDLPLTLTTPTESSELSFAMRATISQDGQTIAARLARPPWVGIYSVREKRWTALSLSRKADAIVISPNASHVAFVVTSKVHPPNSEIHVIELSTGAERVIQLNQRVLGCDPSWSPSGRSLVYSTIVLRDGESPKVETLDLESGKITKLDEGQCPAWSPSGEWIAFFYTADHPHGVGWAGPTSAPTHLVLARPDGTEKRILLTFSKARQLGILFPEPRRFDGAPIWSPDSHFMLLNEKRPFTDDGNVDVLMLQIANRKMKRIFKDVTVYGWAPARTH